MLRLQNLSKANPQTKVCESQVILCPLFQAAAVTVSNSTIVIQWITNKSPETDLLKATQLVPGRAGN